MKKFWTIQQWIKEIIKLSYDPLFNLEHYLEHQKLNDKQKELIKEKLKTIDK